MNPSQFSLHYITRVFNASLDKLEKFQHKIEPSKIDLSRIRNSKHILGLVLTYYINYGLSLRKTALILYEIHDIKISHQTIANYAQAASHLLFPWMDNYKHNLNSYQCGDETYVKVLGKKAYVFFMCDVKKKIITSYRIYMKRDTFSAIDAFYSVLRKFKKIPEDLEFVVDGNPIYKAAQQYFQLKRIFFKVTQVIGLTNDDPVSKQHRPAKPTY
ncbi:DDE-type integrase/transposase/recombinase [Longibaculum muris]|uniref:DDE-type integrase/transposase/recombinase n=1 Tax=Longibaculum muris TaxID=1796628 RepID=UPI0012B865D9|nr:DDE-type integrase/transposase/recombinase [Longibaculum muris]